MASLYALFSNQAAAEMFTLLLLGLLFLAVVLYKRNIIEQQQVKPTGFDKALIYSSVAIALFCGILLFGKLLFPDNADSLLQMLGLNNFMKAMTMNFQDVVLGIIGLLL